VRIQLVAIAWLIACKPEAPQHTEVGLSMAQATPFGALKGIAPGASFDQVKRVLPAAVVAGSGSVISDQQDGVAYVVTLANGRVEQLQILVEKRAIEELWQAWRSVGEIDADGKHHFWDRAKGMRADVTSLGSDSFAIEFVHYVPLDKVLAGNTPGSIDHVEVLGRPLADVVHDFKGHRAEVHDDDAQHATIKFSRDEWSVQPVELSLLSLGGSNVDQLAVSNIVWAETPEITKHLRTILQTRYGGSGAGEVLAEHPSVKLVDNIIIVQ
jgi:hypothetical protein